MLIPALLAFCLPISQMLIARLRQCAYAVVARSKVRNALGICVVSAVPMCTAAPILFARDGAGLPSPAALNEIACLEAEISRIEALFRQATYFR